MRRFLLLILMLAMYQSYAQPTGNKVGINTTSPQATLDINGDIIIRSMPLVVSDGVNISVDVNTDRFSNYKVQGPTADFVIAGLVAGADGRMITLNNRSGFLMQLSNEDAAAQPIEQIITGTGATLDINAGGMVTLQYDGDLQKWVVQSKNNIIPGGGGTSYWTLNGSHIYNNNAGNVGIGVNNPFAKLHLKKDNEAMVIQRATPYIGFYDNAGTYKGFLWQGPGDNMSIGTSYLNSTGSLQFYNNGILNASITSSGVMDLSGSLPWLRLNDGGNRSGDLYGDGSNLEIAAYKSGIFGVPGNLILQASDFSVFQDLYAGNVGIGVRDPVFKLDIGSRIRLRSGSTSETSGLWLNNPTNSAAHGFIGTAQNNVIGLYGSNFGWGLIMNTVSGNIGIGTLNPTFKLSVNGTIRTKEVVVETGWADYVFDEKYPLRSLEDVERFIKTHKHLPNIPSAKEVEEKGLYMGDMQKKMMEKIEELTLYIIELKKEIESLKKSSNN
jgi:hypothetical protein